jgi:hypothetical protein
VFSVSIPLLQAINKAVACYCAASNWSKALFVTAADGRSDLIEAVVVPALKSRAEQMIESAQRWSTELLAHSERLRVVRANKSARLLTWVESGKGRKSGMGHKAHLVHSGEPDFAESEVYSEASTAISATTNSSLRSGQSMGSSRRGRARHMDRKKASMKEGNKYEDLALMGAIRQLIVHIDAAQGRTDRSAHYSIVQNWSFR